MLSDVILYSLAAVGLLVAGGAIVREARGVVRAARQTGRICAILARGTDRPMAARDRIRIFRQELGAIYDTLTIGPWRLPHDGRGRITRAYRYPF